MGSVAGGGPAPAGPGVPEDTVDLRERLDPVRTLLHRASAGDARAAAALVDVLGPRILGLAVHVTGSPARAEQLTVSVLRGCLRDAGDLAAGVLPGEVAVLDRARRAVVATNPTGDVRSLLGGSAAAVEDRTSDRREVEVLRALLGLPAAERALVESAAQGRFPYTGAARREAAAPLTRALDRLRALGGPEDPELRALAALDALALADAGERLRLEELTRTPETASVHLHALEAAAALTVLTAVGPARSLRPAVLEGFGAPAPRHPAPPAAAGSAPGADGRAGAGADASTGVRTGAEAEAAYRGTYATPVLGTDSQQRLVGPPVRSGGRTSSATEPSALSPATPDSSELPPGSPAHGAPTAPAFAFRPTDEKERTRRDRRRARRREREAARGPRGTPWISRTLAALAAVCALVLGVLLHGAHQDLEHARDFSAAWSELSLEPGSERVVGLSDNGDWGAVLGEEGIALRAEDVAGWEGEVLELWAEQDGSTQSLGVLDLSGEGTIEFLAPGSPERLFVTREMSPGSESGTPSSRVVANLDPALTGTDA